MIRRTESNSCGPANSLAAGDISRAVLSLSIQRARMSSCVGSMAHPAFYTKSQASGGIHFSGLQEKQPTQKLRGIKVLERMPPAVGTGQIESGAGLPSSRV